MREKICCKRRKTRQQPCGGRTGRKIKNKNGGKEKRAGQKIEDKSHQPENGDDELK